MEATNPYQPPQGKLEDANGEYGAINIFSVQGRLGRLR